MLDLFFGGSGDEGDELKPASERALDHVLEWVSARAGGFVELVPDSNGRKVPKAGRVPQETLGYLSDEALLVLPGALRRMLAENGISDRVVLPEWKAAGLIETHKGACTLQLRIGGKRTRCVAFKREACGLGPPGVSGVTDAEFQD